MNSPEIIVYIMTFFSDKEKIIRLVEEQYLALRNSLNDSRFVEINGSLINTADIKALSRTVERRKPLGSIGNFTYYTIQEWEDYQASK